MALVELKLSAVDRRIHLIEPYVSAVGLQAVSEGVARWIGTQGHREYITPEQITTALQLLTLDDRVSILDPVGAEDLLTRNGITHIDLTGLRRLGVIDFVDGDASLYKKRRRAKTLQQTWEQEGAFLQAYEDFVSAQLSAVGLPIHWSLVRLLHAVRIGDSLGVELLQQSIPPQDRHFARAKVSGGDDPIPEFRLALDARVLNVLIQLDYAFNLALVGKARVAGAMPLPARKPEETDLGDCARQVWKVVVDRLMPEGIEFPVPQCFKDVVRLRAVPEVSAFREFLFPFIDSAVSGDAETFERLRKEVHTAVRALRRLPGMRKTIAWVTYAAIPVSVAEAFSGLIGPSIGLGLVPVGMERLAKRWERRSNWLYLAGRT